MLYDIVHININVTDIDRSIAFYEKLGFRVIHVFGDEKRGGDGLDKSGDVHDGMHSGQAHSRGVVLGISDHPRAFTKIELLEWTRPRTKPVPKKGMHEAGVARIALRCKDLRAFAASLEEQGVVFEGPVQEVDIVGAKAFVLFRDPDGTLLELIEF